MLLAMSLHPEVLKKAHAELDVVVGPDRLPDFSDRDSLVYVNAIVKETFRWHSVVPLSLPHRTTADEEINGYFIPEGTILLPNTWCVIGTMKRSGELLRRTYRRACMHDPVVYPDPHAFRPERFIRDGQLDKDVRDPSLYVFGYGRR